MKSERKSLSKRFGGLLPIVVDLETSGIDSVANALLEVAAVSLAFDANGMLRPKKTVSYHVEPFVGARLDQVALDITGIDPDEPLRFAIPEMQALHRLFMFVKEELRLNNCQRAILVGHNAWFDLAFISAATKRCSLVSPFHSFTTIDTASLSAVALCETVLARAAKAARIYFDVSQAHSAIYDAEKTAELFCYLVNKA